MTRAWRSGKRTTKRGKRSTKGQTVIDQVEIAKLELERGDILVVRISRELSADNVSSAIEAAMKSAGVCAPILIGHHDVDFQVLKAPANDQRG
jgi:hypothetical protein